MSQHIADNGTVITDDMVARWAKDAENGFPNRTVESVEGRPWKAHRAIETPNYPRLGHTT